MTRRAGKIKLKRAYERPDLGDGTRILQERPELIEEIRKAARGGPVTLVYAARDEAHNDAVVLKELLTGVSAES